MKKNIMSVLFMSAFAYRMSDDAPGAGTEPIVTVEPTKESLLQRVEDLFEKGIEGVEHLIHDALTVVEGMFASDEDATLDVTTNDAAAGTTETPQA